MSPHDTWGAGGGQSIGHGEQLPPRWRRPCNCISQYVCHSFCCRSIPLQKPVVISWQVFSTFLLNGTLWSVDIARGIPHTQEHKSLFYSKWTETSDFLYLVVHKKNTNW